jgi:hypothetical protein
MFILGGISESALEEGGGYCSNKDSQRRVYTPDMAGMESLSTRTELNPNRVAVSRAGSFSLKMQQPLILPGGLSSCST